MSQQYDERGFALNNGGSGSDEKSNDQIANPDAGVKYDERGFALRQTEESQHAKVSQYDELDDDGDGKDEKGGMSSVLGKVADAINNAAAKGAQIGRVGLGIVNGTTGETVYPDEHMAPDGHTTAEDAYEETKRPRPDKPVHPPVKPEFPEHETFVYRDEDGHALIKPNVKMIDHITPGSMRLVEDMTTEMRDLELDIHNPDDVRDYVNDKIYELYAKQGPEGGVRYHEEFMRQQPDENGMRRLPDSPEFREFKDAMLVIGALDQDGFNLDDMSRMSRDANERIERHLSGEDMSFESAYTKGVDTFGDKHARDCQHATDALTSCAVFNARVVNLEDAPVRHVEDTFINQLDTRDKEGATVRTLPNEITKITGPDMEHLDRGTGITGHSHGGDQIGSAVMLLSEAANATSVEFDPNASREAPSKNDHEAFSDTAYLNDGVETKTEDIQAEDVDVTDTFTPAD